MEKETITTKQFIAIMTMFMIGSALITAVQAKVQQDFWIAYILTTVYSLFVFFVYSRIISLFPQKNLLDILKLLLGKIVGTIIYVSYVFMAFTIGCTIIRHFIEYIQVVSLPETPQYAFAICFVLISIYIVKKGIEPLGRWSLFSLPIIIFIFLITIIFSLQLFNPRNLKPVFQSEFGQIVENAYNSYILPFGECAIFLLMLDSLKNGKKTYKVFFISTIIAVSMIMLAFFRNIMVLGAKNCSLLFSASLSAVSVISARPFIERIEVIVTIIFIICGIAKVSVCLMGTCKGCAKLLKLDSGRHIAAPLGMLMLVVVSNYAENIMQFMKWFNVFRIIFIPQQIIFPIVIWIIAEIKNRTSNKLKAGVK